MSRISEHVTVSGKVKLRNSFELLSSGLIGLAEIVERARLANTEEAYTCPRGNSLLVPTITKFLATSLKHQITKQRDKQLDTAESFFSCGSFTMLKPLLVILRLERIKFKQGWGNLLGPSPCAFRLSNTHV